MGSFFPFLARPACTWRGEHSPKTSPDHAPTPPASLESENAIDEEEEDAMSFSAGGASSTEAPSVSIP